MGIILLLIVIGIYVVVDTIRDFAADKRERDRRDAKATFRRQYLARSPDSPAAYEMLGDALREADDPGEAVTCYEKALDLASKREPGTAVGAGMLSGSGLETKLRLARLDVSERTDPGKHGQTMRTRQQFCRSCGFLGQPGDVNCRQCDVPLPVDTMLDTWRNTDMRRSIIAECVRASVIVGVVLACVIVASWLPLEARACIAISAVIVVPIRLLKKIGGS